MIVIAAKTKLTQHKGGAHEHGAKSRGASLHLYPVLCCARKRPTRTGTTTWARRCVCVCFNSAVTYAPEGGLCVCVNARTWRHDSRSQMYITAGGHNMSLGLCPTKLPVAWEARADHQCVPAKRPPRICTLNAVVLYWPSEVILIKCFSALGCSRFASSVLAKPKCVCFGISRHGARS